jgi:hypothetical protein
MAIDLIRMIDGIEVPALGRWTIASGYSIIRRDPGGWGRRRRSDRITGGLLVIGVDLPTCRLELAGGAVDDNGATGSWQIDGELVEADRYGVWRFTGSCQQDTGIGAADIVARYHGVYRHGGRATAWLGLAATIGRHTATTSRPRRFTLHGEIGATIEIDPRPTRST